MSYTLLVRWELTAEFKIFNLIIDDGSRDDAVGVGRRAWSSVDSTEIYSIAYGNIEKKT